MPKEFWTITEVLEILQVDKRFILDLEEEEIVCPTCREEESNQFFDINELEKLRLAKILVEDMGINLEGVDVILRMRQSMLEMRRQFDAILEDLAKQLQENFEGNR